MRDKLIPAADIPLVVSALRAALQVNRDHFGDSLQDTRYANIPQVMADKRRLDREELVLLKLIAHLEYES